MIRTLRALPPLLLLPVLLTAGCGTEKAGANAGAGGSATPADPARLKARAQALGIAPELVYVTGSPGYTLARQSVGVSGDDGFSAVYWSPKTNTQIEIRVDRGTLTAATCPRQPVGDAPDGQTRCTREGDAWYRSAGRQHGYAQPRKGYVIWLTGAGVPRATLHKALLAAHHPSAAELADLLPPAPTSTPTAPVRRGDLPPNGDGAPNNAVPSEGG
ncbi:hypothetical protein [Streptomyces sp. NPDC048419]|uniref:hypothetical protein n=1 Tax=Streptomyces sp. NPDC048419 TaxID=3365547 RepID=UPI00371B5BBD